MPVRGLSNYQSVRLSGRQVVRVRQAVSSLSGVSRPSCTLRPFPVILRRCVSPWCAPYLGCKENSCHCQATCQACQTCQTCQAVRACQAGLDTHDTRRAWLLSRTPDTSLTLALASPKFYVSGLSRLSDSCQQLSGSAVRTVKPGLKVEGLQPLPGRTLGLCVYC